MNKMDTLSPINSREIRKPRQGYATMARPAAHLPIMAMPSTSTNPVLPRPGAGNGMSALLAGLQENYQEPTEETLSEKAEEVTENVSTPTNQAATITKALSEGRPAEKLAETASKVGGSRSGATAVRTLEGVNKASQTAGKLGESAFVAAKPFSIANNVKSLVQADSGEDRATAATSLASDVGYTAQAVGAGAEGGSGLSKVATIASAQSKVLEAAPKVAGVAAKVGKAAPVLGAVSGVVSGGFQIKDAVSGDEVDKSKLASGSLKVASGVALAVPGGLPVAMGLGAAALAIDHKDTIVKGAKKVGEVASDGAKAVAGVAKGVGGAAVDGVKKLFG